jgi:ankyrin repeat protein
MVRLLLEHHSDPNVRTVHGGVSPLMNAADWGEDAAAGVLIAAGADVNARSRVGRSPLMYAAAGGHDGVVWRLLAAGADPAASDADGHTAADEATTSGHPATADLLARASSPRYRSAPSHDGDTRIGG